MHRVLIVDDRGPNRTLLRAQLEADRHAVADAADGLIEEAIELTRVRWDLTFHERNADNRLPVDLYPQLPDVMGARHEIRDAVMNLIFNAVDAMPSGGAATLRTRYEAGAGDEPRRANRVLLEISDSGEGMSEETKKRCLEPFFTTKGDRDVLRRITRGARGHAGRSAPGHVAS